MSTDHIFLRERRAEAEAEAESNRGPSAYQIVAMSRVTECIPQTDTVTRVSQN